MIFFEKTSFKIKQLQEKVVIAAFGSVPDLFLGTLIRRLIYSSILGRLEKTVYIQAGVELLGPRAIILSSGVSLFRGVYIDARGKDSEVFIGANSSLQRNVEIRTLNRSRLRIGKRVFIGSGTCIAGPGNVEIGDNCSIAAHCGIFANQHKFNDSTLGPNDQGLTWRGIVIEKKCWIGHGVSILDGVRVGEGCVVGAGAVVNKDLPPNSIAVGVPAKVIKQRESSLSNLY